MKLQLPFRQARTAWIGAVLVLAIQAAASAAGPARPNVLVVLLDDFGYGDASCYGGAKVLTPAIDRLAAGGVRFTQFYVAAPICSPSRCGLLTGRFPGHYRLTSYLQTRAGNRLCEQVDFLAPTAPNYVRTFQAAGYATAHVGKWHLGGGRDVAQAPKFAAYGYQAGWGTYESPEPAAALGLKTVPWGRELEPGQVARHDRTRWMVDQALQFIREHRAQPWLVNLWLDDVHTPFRPAPEQLQQAAQGVGSVEYRAVLQATDRELGRLQEGLEQLGMADKTLVVLAGDNGPEPSFERARTAGLRGMKWSLYEGGIRTPLIVCWPGVIPAGRASNTVISAVDVFPSLCVLAGLEPPPGAVLDGEDLSAAWRGAEVTRKRPLFWEYGRKPPAAQQGLRAFPYPSEPGAKSPNVAVRSGDWKLLVNAGGDGAELYDLARDPSEARNLASTEVELTQRLSALALDWRKRLPPPGE